MRRILFVDDEPNVLEGLQRMLYPLRKEWKMAFANSGVKALELMAQEPFDIVVSDMRMPGMDGAQLLAEVRERYPNTIRFVLSGQSDRETIFRSVGAAHQFLSKPCNPKDLKATVDRAFALRDVFHNSKVSETISRVGSLPPLPEMYGKLVALLQSPDSSIADVARVIESDVAMTAKILQLVNSAFFGVRRQVNTAAQAVGLLGLDIIRSLVLVSGLFQSTSGRTLSPHFSMDSLWDHSMMVGGYAQIITKKLGAGEAGRSETLTAGLLHDVGKLLLASGFPKEYGTCIQKASSANEPLDQHEAMLFGCTHAEVGAYLLGIWGLPDPIVEAVAFHHQPEACESEQFTPLAAVCAANVFAHEDDAIYLKKLLSEIGNTYLKTLTEQTLQEWLQECRGALDKTKESS